MEAADEEVGMSEPGIPRLSFGSYDSTIGQFTSARSSFASTATSGPSQGGSTLSPFPDGSLSMEPGANHSDAIIRTSSSLTIRPQKPTRRSLTTESQRSLTNLRTSAHRAQGQRASSSPGLVWEPRADDWGKQFWVVIVDPGVSEVRGDDGLSTKYSHESCLGPQSGHEFFYNPSMGEARWVLPAGTPVLPVNPDGHWLEFYDATTQRLYYYQNSTQTTQWERPQGLVIPVKALQDNLTSSVRRDGPSVQFRSSSRRPLSMSCSAPSSPTPSHRHSVESARREQTSLSAARRTHRGSVRTAEEYEDRRNDAAAAEYTSAHADERLLSQRRRRTLSNEQQNRFVCQLKSITERSLATTLSTSQKTLGDSGSPQAAPSSPPTAPAASTSSRPISVGSLLRIPRPPGTASSTRGRKSSGTEAVQSLTASTYHSGQSLLTADDSGTTPSSPKSDQRYKATLFRGKKKSQRYLKQLFGFKATSPTTSPGMSNPNFPLQEIDLIMPTSTRELPNPLQHFEHYAATQLALQRRGLFQKKTQPLDNLAWTEQPSVNVTFLPLDKNLHHLAACTFKVILRLCGEQARSVFYPKPPAVAIGYKAEGKPASKGALGSAVSAMGFSQVRQSPTRKRDYIRPSRKGQASTTLEEQKWLLEVGISTPALRDEIFCQLITRLNIAAPLASRGNAWRFLGVVLSTFSPLNKELLDALMDFIKDTYECGAEDTMIAALASHAERKVMMFTRKRLRRRSAMFAAPGLLEVERSWEEASTSEVFGQSLAHLMTIPAPDFPPTTGIPAVLPFLFGRLVAFGGLQVSGVFQAPGDAAMSRVLRSKLDQGLLSLNDCVADADKEAAVLPLATLIVNLFEELEDPLILQTLYNDCLEAASSDDIKTTTALVRSHLLPIINRRVLLFIVAALQGFCDEEVVKKTGADAQVLSKIFGPVVLR